MSDVSTAHAILSVIIRYLLFMFVLDVSTDVSRNLLGSDGESEDDATETFSYNTSSTISG